MRLGTCIAAPFVVLTLAACGSSGASSDDSSKGESRAASTSASGGASTELSRTELIAEADKICDDTGDRIRALPAPTSIADVVQFSEESASASDDGVRKLEALTPPDSVKADYEAFVERAETVAEQAHKVADAARTGDISKAMAATGNVADDAESHRLARKIGFKVCRGGSASLLPRAP